ISEPRPSVTANSRCPSCLISWTQPSPMGGSNEDDATRKRISAGRSDGTAVRGKSTFDMAAGDSPSNHAVQGGTVMVLAIAAAALIASYVDADLPRVDLKRRCKLN